MQEMRMRKLLIRMGATILILSVLFAWNQRAQNQATVLAAGEQGVSVPIVMYHSILKDQSRAGQYVLSPDALRADLDYLKQNGFQTVTVSDLVDYVDGIATLPEKPVMITFDDGFYNNYLYAYPLLKERDMQAVISVIGDQTVLFTENQQENAYWSYLSADRLIEMEASGVFEIQNHSYSMHEIGKRRGCMKNKSEDDEQYRTILTQDVVKSQTLLAESGVTPPICYTYPYGAYCPQSEVILKEMGFRCTLSCEERVNLIVQGQPESLYLLGRYNRPSGISTTAFFDKVLH